MRQINCCGYICHRKQVDQLQGKHKTVPWLPHKQCRTKQLSILLVPWWIAISHGLRRTLSQLTKQALGTPCSVHPRKPCMRQINWCGYICHRKPVEQFQGKHKTEPWLPHKQCCTKKLSGLLVPWWIVISHDLRRTLSQLRKQALGSPFWVHPHKPLL